ncbi:MAG: hypothetical protein L0226_02180 [Acidobacteria bacterium]|nr:hypothetical protein [Acidobacteriota bacterium]
MFEPIQIASGKKNAARKLYSIHALPSGRGFAGIIAADKAKYQFVFAPQTAELVNRKLVLTGSFTVKSPNGQKRVAENVKATLLATQGSITTAPPVPRTFEQLLKQAPISPDNSPAVTDATGDLSSVAVIYLKLSPLGGKALGLPADLSQVQLNARLYSTSEVERDLQWFYSALIRATLGESPDEQIARGYLAEINRILKG